MDGDAGFTQVNARLHPSMLPAGVLAGASNRTLELGDCRARWAAISAVWGDKNLFSGTPLAIGRWWEPITGEEALVVITGAARTDGGMGRAWKLTSSSPPVEISLGGHDVWTTCRLVPQRQALLLLRQGNTRHYFKASDIDTGTDVVTLHLSTPDLVNGDRILFKLVDNATPPLPLQDNTNYFAKVTGASLEIYTDSGLTSKVAITTAGTGTFYVERTSLQPGPGGLGALPLLLEPGWSAGDNMPAWTRGFRSVPQSVSCTIAHQASVWEALNHRLAAGQAVKLAAGWDVTTPADPTTHAAGTILYARPTDAHHFTLHLTAAGALLNTGILVDSTATAGGVTTSVAPSSYSGQPMVSLREGVEYKNRLVGLNGRCNVAVSDPGDFLHFTPFEAALTAALGNGDALVTILEVGENAFVLPTQTNVLAITGTGENDTATWSLRKLPGAKGCVAALTALTDGDSGYWLGRGGFFQVKYTDNGVLVPQKMPLSATISRKMNQVDWTFAAQSCGVEFNNRLFWACPLKGQEGTPVNNCIFVYNKLAEGWEGYWTGTQINPVQFAVHTVGGQERLCWLDAAGSVRFFDEDGLEDITLSYSAPDFTHNTVSIPTEDLTRAYLCGMPGEKQYHEVELVLETWNANWSLSAITDGVNEETIYRSSETKDPTKFLVHDTADFDQATEAERAALPYREDYSVAVSTDLSISGAGLAAANGTYVYAGDAVSTFAIWSQGNPSGPAYFKRDDEDHYAIYLEVSGTEWLLSSKDDFGYSIPLYRAPTANGPWTVYLGNNDPAPATGQPGEVALPTAGLPLEPHQVYVLPIALSERDYSLQFRLTNTTGSLRLRSLRVKATPLKG